MALSPLRDQIHKAVLRKHKVTPTKDLNVAVDLDSFLDLREAYIEALYKLMIIGGNNGFVI